MNPHKKNPKGTCLMLFNSPRQLRRPALLSAVALTAGLALAGCGGAEDTADEESSPQATETTESTSEATAETSAESSSPEDGTVPDFTDGSLYDAIVFARENDLSYELDGAEIGDIENTREVTVTDQDPEPGTEFAPRDVLTLTVEQQ